MVWCAVSLLLGGALGFSAVHFRAAAPDASLYLLGLGLGSIAGVALGCLPGPAWRALRRVVAGLLLGFWKGLSLRRLRRLRSSAS
jgi:hypothetical protein